MPILTYQQFFIHGVRYAMEFMEFCGVFIFELKVDEPASAAIEQLRAKGYDAPYRGKGLPIHLIGLSFDFKTRHLVDAKAET